MLLAHGTGGRGAASSGLAVAAIAMAQQQQQPWQWGQALGGQRHCQHLWQQQRQGVVLLACGRGGREAASSGLAAAVMTMAQQQWQPWQQGQALAKQRQHQHLRLQQGVALCACGATRLQRYALATWALPSKNQAWPGWDRR
jgi:hypothetical protein